MPEQLDIKVKDELFPIVVTSEEGSTQIVLFANWTEAVDFVGRSWWRRLLFNIAGGGNMNIKRNW